MGKFSIIILVVMTCWIQSTAVPNGSQTEPVVAKYKGDSLAAFSYTFDDGFNHQVENALSVIDPLGIRGTFFVMPLAIENDPEQFISWERLREIRGDGHEIGTHASIKPKLHEVDLDVARSIINGGWTLIRDKVGVASVSFAYPGGSKRNAALEKIVAEHHYFVRRKASGYGSTDFRTWTSEGARKEVREAIKNREWLVTYVHAIIKGYSPFASIAEFRDHSQWLVGLGDQLWIAPMGEVGAYVQQREAVELVVLNPSDNSLELQLTGGRQPLEVFDKPLTVVVPTEMTAINATAEPVHGNRVIPVTIRGKHILVDISVGDGRVELRWENP